MTATTRALPDDYQFTRAMALALPDDDWYITQITRYTANGARVTGELSVYHGSSSKQRRIGRIVGHIAIEVFSDAPFGLVSLLADAGWTITAANVYSNGGIPGQNAREDATRQTEKGGGDTETLPQT